MIELYTPNGIRVEVPETKIEDATPRFNVEIDKENAINFYKDNGYVIFNGCVLEENCIKLRNLWEKIIKPYKSIPDLKNIGDSFYFDTPGNILNYLLIFKDSDIDFSNDKLDCILYLIEKYKHKNDTKLLTFISLLIELFYKDKSLRNNENLDLYSMNKFNLLNRINDAKKFNLDKKNLFTSLIGTLEHESK